MTDFDVLQHLNRGDEAAFEYVFNKYFEGLCLFAEAVTKDHDTAQDIVEDIFLQLWLNCKFKPIETSVKSYLYQSVYNNSVKHVMRRRRSEPLENMAQLQTSDYPAANLIEQELEEKATAIINSLPEQCRQVYLLNRDEDLKYREIAERLQISESTVKTQMSRAFAKLRESLKDFLYLFL